ncbi:MAG: type II toxin-antitoxin system VapC family toxin [archaeon]|nr:type II toxin-antitoxin system VapC family toxin [archaeon]
MSYILDSSAIFRAIKENVVETLVGNYTLELARYELGNVLWKEYLLHKKINKDELRRLVRLIKEVLHIVEVLGIDCHEEEILDIAEELKSTFYDASYIFYAKEKKLSLITEDEALLNKARNYVKALKLSDVEHRPTSDFY